MWDDPKPSRLPGEAPRPGSTPRMPTPGGAQLDAAQRSSGHCAAPGKCRRSHWRVEFVPNDIHVFAIVIC